MNKASHRKRSLRWGITLGLTLGLGGVLQGWTGGVDWEWLAWPLNGGVAVSYLLLLVVLFRLRKRLYVVRWAMTYEAAVPALLTVVGLTFLMGIIRQEPASVAWREVSVFSRMLSFWPFVLAYSWMTTLVGWVTLRHLVTFRPKKIPFLFNHGGLFLALVAGTLGSADQQRLMLHARMGQLVTHAMDSRGRLHTLPFAIELQQFNLDEYPPKLMRVEVATGQTLPREVPEYLWLEASVESGLLSGWRIDIRERMEQAAPVSEEATAGYVEWPRAGAAYAVRVKAVSPDGRQTVDGWVSSGSDLFPARTLRLDSLCSLVIPEREPRRFASEVLIHAACGEPQRRLVEVNRPVEIDGWTLYQSGYDDRRGRWSEWCVYELVSDPWLPAVYAGIVLMMLGAVGLFFLAPQVNRDNEPKV